MEISLPKLNLPSYELNINESNGGYSILDPIRKKYVKLTPEEWVRQNFLMYLQKEKSFPRGFISVELEIAVGKLKRRCDAVVYDKSLKPVVIIECKAPEVKITQDTFNQVGIYNINLKVDYLIVTNGLQHFCCKMDYEGHKYTFMDGIPEYREIGV